MQKTFKDAKLWQQAMDLIEEVYMVSRRFPKVEENGLTQEVRRVAIRVASTIAGGYARGTRSAVGRALIESLGLLATLQTQLLVAEKMKYIVGTQIEGVTRLLAKVTRETRAALEGMRQRKKRPPARIKKRVPRAKR